MNYFRIWSYKNTLYTHIHLNHFSKEKRRVYVEKNAMLVKMGLNYTSATFAVDPLVGATVLLTDDPWRGWPWSLSLLDMHWCLHILPEFQQGLFQWWVAAQRIAPSYPNGIWTRVIESLHFTPMNCKMKNYSNLKAKPFNHQPMLVLCWSLDGLKSVRNLPTFHLGAGTHSCNLTAFGRWRQEDHDFKAIPSYRRPCCQPPYLSPFLAALRLAGVHI